MAKVLIGCPTYEGHAFCRERFLERLKELEPKADVLFADNSRTEEHANALRKAGFEVLWEQPKGDDKIARIIQNRNKLVERAIEKKYDYLLFVDSDILLPTDVVAKLSKHNQPIVGGVYLSGAMISGEVKIAPVLRAFTDKQDYYVPVALNDIMKDEFVELAAIGFGCCLIRRDVLEAVKLRYNKELGGGEDFIFCYDAKENGFRTFADTSVKCIHMQPEMDIDFPVAVYDFGFQYNTGYEFE